MVFSCRMLLLLLSLYLTTADFAKVTATPLSSPTFPLAVPIPEGYVEAFIQEEMLFFHRTTTYGRDPDSVRNTPQFTLTHLKSAHRPQGQERLVLEFSEVKSASTKGGQDKFDTPSVYVYYNLKDGRLFLDLLGTTLPKNQKLSKVGLKNEKVASLHLLPFADALSLEVVLKDKNVPLKIFLLKNPARLVIDWQFSSK